MPLFALLLACTSADPQEEPYDPYWDCGDKCLGHSFPTLELDAYSENPYLCLSWTLDNDASLWINAVATENDGFIHHANWYWVPETFNEMDDGAWRCSQGDFTEFMGVLSGGVLYAQSTQATQEVQQFEPGAAVEIPARSRIIAATHTLNYTDEIQNSAVRVELHALDQDQVTTVLKPLRLSYNDLYIPAGQSTAHQGDCDLTRLYDDNVDAKLHYLLPHYHGWGTGFELEVLGGPRDGELIYGVQDVVGDALGHTFDTPYDLTGADGLRFRCLHDNPGNTDVVFGNAEGEMCMMLGFADTDKRFTADVNETLDSSVDGDNVLVRSGDCFVVGGEI
jgi:hypothetical protein